jgi:putative iron-dependent peroxidase
MINSQPGILEPIPDHGKYLFFDLLTGGNVTHSLRMLAKAADGSDIVVGIGESLALRLGARVPGLKSFPVLTRAHVGIPSTQSSLMCWLRGTDPGDLFHRV